MTTQPAFDLDGGRPCLDFANTLSASSGEHLHTYPDLVAFAAQSDLLTPHDADWLRASALADQHAAERVMDRAYRLRAAIYAVFSSLAAGSTPNQADMDVVNGELAASMQHARVEPSASGFQWTWGDHQLDMPLWGIARSAAELLTSEKDRRRVRECSGTNCRWLFVDTSRNRSRQWCSMQSCGNRQKARRHYQRVRAQRVSS